MNNCSPLVTNIKKLKKGGKNKTLKKINTIAPISDKTCLDYETLKLLAEAWNMSMKHNKSEIININDHNSQSLFMELKKKFKNEEDIMWFDNEVIKSVMDESKIDEIKKKYFKAKAPQSWVENPHTWLSNHDINAVLNQYELKYPEFKSFGAMPIDFDLKKNNSCLINEICELNISDLYHKKKYYIGCVFNLDPHTESGSHWIALFVNILNGEINFWDSTSNYPPQEVKKLMLKIENQLNKLKEETNNTQSNKLNFTKAKQNFNVYQHQYGGSECGVYCLYFITEQLDKDRSFTDVCKHIVTDAKMNKMRINYFIIKKEKNNSLLGGLFNF